MIPLKRRFYGDKWIKKAQISLHSHRTEYRNDRILLVGSILIRLNYTWIVHSCPSHHNRQPFSVSFFQFSLPPPPLICISYAVLTAPLECFTCPNHQSLLSLKMRLSMRSSSFASSSIDLTASAGSNCIEVLFSLGPSDLLASELFLYMYGSIV